MVFKFAYITSKFVYITSVFLLTFLNSSFAMALNSRLEPRVYLQWVTERPYAGGSRLSPDFSILQNEWYLELKLTRNFNTNLVLYYYEIWIHPRRPSPSPSNFHLAVDSQLKVRSSSYFKIEYLRNNTQSTCILKQRTYESDISSSGIMEEWTVICTFKDTEGCKSFALQVGNKTVNLSLDNKNSPLTCVDACVQVSSEIPLDTEALSSDISGLLKDEILPDFKLECGGQVFPVHRSVLAARSEVFRAMFRSRMLESETGSTNIQDLEVPVLKTFLKFLYSGKLDDLSDVSASNLYEAADKYAVHSLRAACSYWMVRNLTEDNCVSYLSVSNSHSDADLKSAVMTFILDRPRVFKSSAWIKFSENHLKEAFEVLQAYAASTVQRSTDED